MVRLQALISLSHPWILFLVVPVLVATLAVWKNGYINLGTRRRIASLLVRIAIVTSIILALAGLAVQVPENRQATLFVADLSASNASNRSAMRDFINKALQQRPRDDVAGVVTVGRQALVEQPVGALAPLDSFQSAVKPDGTNLESGIELGNAILPDGYRRRIVVLSDGQENAGSALSAARLLHAQDVRIDVVPQRSVSGPDVRIDAVTVPSELRTNERFSVGVKLHSTVSATTRLDVYRDHSLILTQNETLRAGDASYRFGQAPLKPGFHTYDVRSTAASDTQPQNDQGSAFTDVQGPAHVLIVGAPGRAVSNIAGALRSTGITTETAPPDQVVSTLGALQRYAGIVIVDTAAPLLGSAFLDQLIPYVRDLGRGLLVVGGQESYSLGGYGHTPLEQVLPVKMDPPHRKDVPSVAVAVVIESLESPQSVDISKEAGKGVVKLLTEQDQIGVNDTPTDGSTGWAVPLQPVRDKQAILNAIAQMTPGDPNSYVSTIQSAYDSLKRVKAKLKHIILLVDGDAIDPGYQRLIKKIRAAGVTVSTVVTNADSVTDIRAMRNIARWGGGRYYRADDTKSIPQIFLREAHTIGRSGIVEGKFVPQKLSSNAMLRDLHQAPPLYGYVATAAKPAAEIELASHKLDPVLAGWQFGLGRAVAWTSDNAGLWTSDWLASPQTQHFWADVVSWTLPAPSTNRLFVSTTSSGNQGRISVDIPSSLGNNPEVDAHVLGPGAPSTTVQLQPIAPGKYAGAFSAPSEGSYIVAVEARGKGHASAGQTGLSVPYSEEFRTNGTNTNFLRSVARAGGGSIVHREDAVWADNLAGASNEKPLSDFLWLLALLLLPLDVALRRLLFRRNDLSQLRVAFALPRLQPIRAPLAPGVTAPLPNRSHPVDTRAAPRRPSPDVGRSARRESRTVTDAADMAPSQAHDTVSKLLAAKKRQR